MSRDLQHELHAYLELAAQTLDLPLDPQHLEGLAVQLTPAVKALIAEATDAHDATVPVPYTVARETLDEQTGIHTTIYAACTARIGTDVPHDAPAALLAAQLRASQPDVIATNVASPTYLGLSVQPQSLFAWTCWLNRLNVSVTEGAVTMRDNAAYATATVGDVAVELEGLEVPMLLVDESAARLMGLLAETDQASA
ncbi:hypothetical protein [Streptomyces parvulus]|uniref:hypothetical protein n=1 Tax=Streptomyces parvulus TaxID=146923 RepID=UPI00339F62FD